MSSSTYYVYILECMGARYYTGYTTDVLRRFESHCSGTGQCKFTRSFKPERIAQCWSTFECKSEALKIERFIKTLAKNKKQELVLDPDKLSRYFNCIPIREPYEYTHFSHA